MKIYLSKLPEGTKWIAIDEDGDVFACNEEPSRTSYFDSYMYSVEAAVFIGNVHD